MENNYNNLIDKLIRLKMKQKFYVRSLDICENDSQRDNYFKLLSNVEDEIKNIKEEIKNNEKFGQNI